MDVVSFINPLVAAAKVVKIKEYRHNVFRKIYSAELIERQQEKLFFNSLYNGVHGNENADERHERRYPLRGVVRSLVYLMAGERKNAYHRYHLETDAGKPHIIVSARITGLFFLFIIGHAQIYTTYCILFTILAKLI